MGKENYPDPNKIVESWKDAIYEETKSLSGKKLNCYFKDNADTTLKNHRLTLRISKCSHSQELR